MYKKIYIYVFIFVLFYVASCFVLYLNERMWRLFYDYVDVMSRDGFYFSAIETQSVPMKLKIGSMHVNISHDDLPVELTDIVIRVGVFPVRLDFQAKVLGGRARGDVQPSSLAKGEPCLVRLEAEGLAPQELFRLAGKTHFATVLAGRINGTLAATFPLSIPVDPAASEGSVRLHLEGCDVNLASPMLMEPQLEHLDGSLVLDWNKGRLTVQEFFLRNVDLNASATGQAALRFDRLLDSKLDMEAVLRIQLSKLRQELLPQRTLVALKTKNEVRLRVRGTPSAPQLEVQLGLDSVK